MTYGWREPEGAPLGGIELCDQCGFDARAVTDESAELDHVFVQLERLLEHPTEIAALGLTPSQLTSTSSTA